MKIIFNLSNIEIKFQRRVEFTGITINKYLILILQKQIIKERHIFYLRQQQQKKNELSNRFYTLGKITLLTTDSIRIT